MVHNEQCLVEDVMAKLSPEQKSLVRTALIGMQKSYQRQAVKYTQEGKPEFVAIVQKELAKVAGLLAVVEEL